MDCFASLAMTKKPHWSRPDDHPLAPRSPVKYGTPCAVIDMDRVERNIAGSKRLVMRLASPTGRIIQDHKSPLLAQMQVAAGAKGITCQKPRAEEMAEAGSTTS